MRIEFNPNRIDLNTLSDSELCKLHKEALDADPCPPEHYAMLIWLFERRPNKAIYLNCCYFKWLSEKGYKTKNMLRPRRLWSEKWRLRLEQKNFAKILQDF